jgi:hypothetical protein
MDIIRKTQVAAQIVALMQADFSRPNNEEMESVLYIAHSQIRDATQIAGMRESEAQSSSVHHFAR